MGRFNYSLILFLFFTVGCGSLDNSDSAGQSVGITLLLKNPDENASGAAKAVEGVAADFAVAKAASTLGVTSCDITCGTASKTISFASGASEVSAEVACPAGSNISISATCADTTKTTNGVNFGFSCSTTATIVGSDSITCTGRFLNQATRSSGEPRYVSFREDDSTQITIEAGFSTSLTDTQKTTAKVNVEVDTAKSATSPCTVDTSSDGLQDSKCRIYIVIEGGLNNPSCFKYNTSGAKELKGTGTWASDGDGNTKAVCKFGKTHWRQYDEDRHCFFVASGTRDGSTWQLIPSSGMAECNTSAATNSDVGSLVGTGASCSTPRACSSGFCAGSSLCGAIPPLTLANTNTVSLVAGPAAIACAGATCPSGTANGVFGDARFFSPSGLVLSPDGNTLYVMDFDNHGIRKIDFTLAATNPSYVTTFCGTLGTSGTTNGACATALFFNPFRGCINTGNTLLYVTELLNDCIREINLGTNVVSTFAGLCGTAGNANGTGTDARFDNPASCEIDSNGTLTVVDSANDIVRRITSGGVVTTLATKSTIGGGSCMDATGTKFYYGTGPGNSIEVVNTVTGTISTVATGVTTSTSCAIDPSNDILYATGGSTENTLKRIAISTGTVTTIAGTSGTAGFTLGLGSSTLFNDPGDLTCNPAGTTCYIADALTNRILKIE